MIVFGLVPLLLFLAFIITVDKADDAHYGHESYTWIAINNTSLIGFFMTGFLYVITWGKL